MPTVQRYGPLTVARNRLPGARKTAAETDLSTGAGLHAAEADAARRVGQADREKLGAISQVGATVASLGGELFAQQMQARREATQRANDVVGYELSNRRDDWTTDALQGPDGALTKKGKDAQDGPRVVLEAFDTMSGELAATLKNDEQRLAYAKDTANRRATLYGMLMKHATQEQRTYEANELQAFRDNKVQAAVAHRDTELLVGADIDAGVKALRTSLPRLGVGPQGVEEQVRQFQSAALEGVIMQSIADENPAAAATYFAKAPDEVFDDKARERITKALKVSDVRAQAQDETARILALPDLPPAQQLAQADGIANREVRDETKRRLEHEHALVTARKREAEAADIDRAYTLVDQGRPIPADLESRLGSALPGLRTYARQRAANEPTPTNLSAWYDLWSLSADDPEKFISLNLPTYKSTISEQDLMELTKLQVSMKKGDKASANQALAGFRTHKEIVDDTLFQYTQTKEKDYTTAQTEAKANLMRQLDLWQAAETASGRKVTNEQVQRRVDEILSHKATKPGSWWALWSPYQFDLRDQPGRFLIDFSYHDISEPERRTLEQALRDEQRPVTPATVLDLYIQIHTKGRAK